MEAAQPYPDTLLLLVPIKFAILFQYFPRKIKKKDWIMKLIRINNFADVIFCDEKKFCSTVKQKTFLFSNRIIGFS